MKCFRECQIGWEERKGRIRAGRGERSKSLRARRGKSFDLSILITLLHFPQIFRFRFILWRRRFSTGLASLAWWVDSTLQLLLYCSIKMLSRSKISNLIGIQWSGSCNRWSCSQLCSLQRGWRSQGGDLWQVDQDLEYYVELCDQVCWCEEGGSWWGHPLHDPMGPEADYLWHQGQVRRRVSSWNWRISPLPPQAKECSRNHWIQGPAEC